MKRDNRMKSYSKLGLAACGLLAMVFVAPATPLAPAHDADACGKRHSYGRYSARTTKKKVKGRWELKITYYNKYYSFEGGSYRLQHVTVYTKSDKVASFVQKKATSADFWKAVRSSASRYNCQDLLEGKRLAKMERSLANAIANHYQKKTRKNAGPLDVMVNMYAPYRAYCNPKKKLARRP